MTHLRAGVIMKQVIVSTEPEEKILLGKVNDDTPIFAKRNGKIRGMIVRNMNGSYSLAIAGDIGCLIDYDSLEYLIRSYSDDYTFHIED